jgi:hypothetical protein
MISNQLLKQLEQIKKTLQPKLISEQEQVNKYLKRIEEVKREKIRLEN